MIIAFDPEAFEDFHADEHRLVYKVEKEPFTSCPASTITDRFKTPCAPA
jgi:hypothetical protein